MSNKLKRNQSIIVILFIIFIFFIKMCSNSSESAQTNITDSESIEAEWARENAEDTEKMNAAVKKIMEQHPERYDFKYEDLRFVFIEHRRHGYVKVVYEVIGYGGSRILVESGPNKNFDDISISHPG